MSKESKIQNGFTLVELLVVIGIIALLISILLPALNKARASARAIACQSNMRQVGQAFQMYAGEYKGIIAPAQMRWDGWYVITWDDLLAKYLGTRYGGSQDPTEMDLYGPYPGDQTGPSKMVNPPQVLRCPVHGR